MDDALVDAIVRSLVETAKAANIWNPQKLLTPVVAELVNRMRTFGYDDEHIHVMLTATVPTVPNGPEAAYTCRPDCTFAKTMNAAGTCCRAGTR